MGARGGEGKTRAVHVRARQRPPGSPGDTEERRGDAGAVAAGLGGVGLAGSNRIFFLLPVAVVSPSGGGMVRGKAGARAAVAANPVAVYTAWGCELLASLCAPPSPDANCCADFAGSRGRQDRMSGYYFFPQQQSFDVPVGASPLEIGQAVQIRNMYPTGHPVRHIANMIVHSEDFGVNNIYTSNYEPSPAAQSFIATYLPGS